MNKPKPKNQVEGIIEGNVSGQVAIGNNINQTLKIHPRVQYWATMVLLIFACVKYFDGKNINNSAYVNSLNNHLNTVFRTPPHPTCLPITGENILAAARKPTPNNIDGVRCAP